MSILSQINKNRIIFDPVNKKHIAMYREFLVNNCKWSTNGCPYELEWPYLTVPDMIRDKIIRKYLKL